MEPLQKPMSPEERAKFEQETGFTAYQPAKHPRWADPYTRIYKLQSAIILGLSLYGRYYAPKIGLSRLPFTVSALLVPLFYYGAIHQKEKRFDYDSQYRRSFQENLEFYPVTRRAFKRALAIREEELRSAVSASDLEDN